MACEGEAFLTYLKSSIAQGGWTTSEGVNRHIPVPLAEGQDIDVDNLTSVKFDGSVDFRGHNDLLRIVIAKPTIEKNGGSWQLTADVASRSLNSSAAPGEIPALKRVVLANLSAPKVSTTDDVSMLSFEKATLTATGSEAFEKFYKPGEQLAPISVALADEESTLPPATPVAK